MKSYIRTFLFAIVVFAILWYLSDANSALDFVKKPGIVVALVALLIAILFNGKIVKNLNEIQDGKLSEEEKLTQVAKSNWFSKFYKKSLDSKSIDEEDTIVLDHNYDGIKELDNNLPPWWIYSFYASIIFAVFYLFKYDVFDGETQFDELATEYVKADAEYVEYLKTAKDLIDFNNVELLTDAADIEKGKEIYTANCVACHKVDGGGSIGPNLTDKNWILGGGINNVFKTVSEGGRDGKSMIAWKQSLKPAEIAQVSSYILSLEGTNPAGAKAAEGDIWKKGDTAVDTETTTEVEEVEEVEAINTDDIKALTSEADLSAGKKLYESNCSACHKADGGGLVGPNLTDKNWIQGGGIKNLVTSISEGGREGKGMIAWKGMLKPDEITQMASYILSLEGTSPAGAKTAEGDIWEE